MGALGSTNRGEFLFSSSYRSLKTQGVFCTITQPAADGARRQGLFQQAVQDALNQARQAGLKDPIVVGALPFDTREPSFLYIPQEYEFFEPDDNAVVRVESHPVVQSATSSPDEDHFKAGVRQALDAFQHSTIKKAVLGRILDLQLAEPVVVDQILASLQARNPTGYRFRVPLTGDTDLIGVSPELLVRKTGSQVDSNPLAGSAKRQSNARQDKATADALLHSGKDGYEHRLVIDEIKRLLAPYCSPLHVPDQPSVLSTSTMWHLSTAIQGVLTDASTSALQLACALHPTPAVCGFPTEQARDLIHRIEPFDRGLFAGTVGWCDASGDGEWVVTIRCATVQRNRIRLFAGAGIVEGSRPDAEWAEIRAKLGTMLTAFGYDDHAALTMNNPQNTPSSTHHRAVRA